MKAIITIAFLIVLFNSACSRKYYYYKGEVSINDSISLRSADLYVRKVFKNANLDSGIYSHRGKDSASYLTEIQYLFVLNNSQKVVYISTVPDKYERFYNGSIIDTFINAYNFQNFYVGKQDSSSITFQLSRSEEMKWFYDLKKDELTINTLQLFKNGQFKNSYPLGHALFEEPLYTKVKNFTCVSFTPDSSLQNKFFLEPILLFDSDYIYFRIENKTKFDFIKFKRSRLKSIRGR